LAVAFVGFLQRHADEGELFGQFLVKLDSNLLSQLLFVTKPLVFKLVLIPLEVPHYRQTLVVIAVQQVLHDLHLFLLPHFD
jgi:hypothetical protein